MTAPSGWPPTSARLALAGPPRRQRCCSPVPGPVPPVKERRCCSWSGAGTGQGRDALLRAHPLLHDGVIRDAVFGRGLVSGGRGVAAMGSAGQPRAALRAGRLRRRGARLRCARCSPILAPMSMSAWGCVSPFPVPACCVPTSPWAARREVGAVGGVGAIVRVSQIPSSKCQIPRIPTPNSKRTNQSNLQELPTGWMLVWELEVGSGAWESVGAWSRS